jgi:ASCH domain
MNLYLQYHNVQNEGLLLSNPPFSATLLAIHTRRPNVRDAEGRVFLVAGVGRPRRYFLWETFEVEAVTANGDGEFEATGTGWQLAPPAELTGKPFEEFKSACANFVGFRCINDLPFARTLNKLAEDHRPPGQPDSIVSFLNRLDGLLPGDDPERAIVRAALGHYQPVRALSIRQPHAEAILRSVKKIEYRSGPTKIRGRILIYASMGRYSAQDESAMMSDYGIRDVSCGDLPRGVLVGSVELFHCDGGDWHVRKPQRAEKLVQPTKQPQPVWFYPF